MRNIMMCNGRAVEVLAHHYANFYRGEPQTLMVAVRERTTGREKIVPADEMRPVAEPESVTSYAVIRSTPMTKLRGNELAWGPLLCEMVRGRADWLSL